MMPIAEGLHLHPAVIQIEGKHLPRSEHPEFEPQGKRPVQPVLVTGHNQQVHPEILVFDTGRGDAAGKQPPFNMLG